MWLTNKEARCCNKRYGDDFSGLPIATRIQVYEEMLFRGLQPDLNDLNSLLVGLSDEEKHEVLLEFALVNAILKDAQAPAANKVFGD